RIILHELGALCGLPHEINLKLENIRAMGAGFTADILLVDSFSNSLTDTEKETVKKIRHGFAFLRLKGVTAISDDWAQEDKAAYTARYCDFKLNYSKNQAELERMGISREKAEELISRIKSKDEKLRIELKYEEMDVLTKNPVPVVQEDENKIGVMDRAIVHEAWLLHRVVSIAVLTPDGKIVVQRAAAKRGERCAGNLTEIGGHVQTDKEYEETALEELQQELKLKNKPTTERLIRVLWRYWPSDEREKDADIKVTYIYILSPEEFNDVKELKTGLEAKMAEMTKEDYKQLLRQQQKDKAGSGEVWAIYLEDVDELKKVAGHADALNKGALIKIPPSLVRRNEFKDGEWSERVLEFSPGLQSIFRKKEVYNKLNDERVSHLVAKKNWDVLAQIGPFAVTLLIKRLEINTLDRSVCVIRQDAAEALGKMGPAAKDAVPSLIQVLTDDSDIEDLRSEDELWVDLQAAEKALNDLRATVACALGNIGPTAKDAIPSLILALKKRESQLSVPEFAAKALAKIGLPLGLIKALQGVDPDTLRLIAQTVSSIPVVKSLPSVQSGISSIVDSGAADAVVSMELKQQIAHDAAANGWLVGEPLTPEENKEVSLPIFFMRNMFGLHFLVDI
ncbi:MAG: NUDIX domain-containing protein, partial [Candidatus Omnitrophica bacterium]|nr:NUDIX domain-containing protein [Candidatus Omnitrophota bacterium]